MCPQVAKPVAGWTQCSQPSNKSSEAKRCMMRAAGVRCDAGLPWLASKLRVVTYPVRRETFVTSGDQIGMDRRAIKKCHRYRTAAPMVFGLAACAVKASACVSQGRAKEGVVLDIDPYIGTRDVRAELSGRFTVCLAALVVRLAIDATTRPAAKTMMA